jgi:hypothetical protein
MTVKDSLIYSFLGLKNHKLPFYALYSIAKALIFLFSKAMRQLRSRNTVMQKK